MSPASYQTAPPRDVYPEISHPPLRAQRAAPLFHHGRSPLRPSPSKHRVQSGKRDSNPRPQPWQGCALPTELFPHTSTGRSYRTRPFTATVPLPRSGGEGDRTPDLVNAIHALSQLSYAPNYLCPRQGFADPPQGAVNLPAMPVRVKENPASFAIHADRIS